MESKKNFFSERGIFYLKIRICEVDRQVNSRKCGE